MKKKVLLFVIAITLIFKVFINKGGIFYPKIVFGFKPISNFYWGSAYTAMEMADDATPEINVLFRRAGNNFKSSFYPVFLTKKAYSQIYINKIMYIYENNNITVLENAIFTFPDKIIKNTKEHDEIGWLTNGEYYCLNGWSAEPENWKVSTETEITLRVDGTLGKTNARDMAVTLYQYSKNSNEGTLSSIATSGVGFLGSKPGIASAFVSLVLALSSDKKNKINDFAFSIMNAVSDYGDLLDSGDYSIHVTGDITINNTIDFFRRKDEVLSKNTTLSSNLNFTLADKNGKEIKYLGKYTTDPSAIQKLLDNYSEKPIKVIEFYNGVPIKIKNLE